LLSLERSSIRLSKPHDQWHFRRCDSDDSAAAADGSRSCSADQFASPGLWTGVSQIIYNPAICGFGRETLSKVAMENSEVTGL